LGVIGIRTLKSAIRKVITGLCLLFFSVQIWAHELRPAIADVSFPDNSVNVSLRLNIEALIAEIGPEHDDTDDSPDAELYDQLRLMEPDDLKQAFVEYLPTLLEHIRLGEARVENSLLKLELASISIPETGDVRVPRDSTVNLQAPLDESAAAFTWQWDARYGPIIIRAEEQAEQEGFSQYLQAGQTSDDIAVVNRQARATTSVFAEYVLIGFEHIIPKGLDHILFVIGLFLLSPYWKPIVWQVTVFTAAHTATLALSTLGFISVPASIVEPLIALSITVVCIENLFRSRFGTARILIVLLFGLLHGLGFASVLGEAGLSEQQFLVSLLGFNIGVEIGQITVILLCFLLVGWWFRAREGYRKWFSVPASLAIGAVGLFWFVTRIIN